MQERWPCPVLSECIAPRRHCPALPCPALPQPVLCYRTASDACRLGLGAARPDRTRTRTENAILTLQWTGRGSCRLQRAYVYLGMFAPAGWEEEGATWLAGWPGRAICHGQGWLDTLTGGDHRSTERTSLAQWHHAV